MDGEVENFDVSGVCGSMNSHTVYQQNGLKALIGSNNSDDIDINGYLKNDDESCIIGLINRHNNSNVINQANLMICIRVLKMMILVMNSRTLYEAKNQNAVDSTKKRDGNFPNASEV